MKYFVHIGKEKHNVMLTFIEVLGLSVVMTSLSTVLALDVGTLSPYEAARLLAVMDDAGYEEDQDGYGVRRILGPYPRSDGLDGHGVRQAIGPYPRSHSSDSGELMEELNALLAIEDNEERSLVKRNYVDNAATPGSFWTRKGRRNQFRGDLGKRSGGEWEGYAMGNDDIPIRLSVRSYSGKRRPPSSPYFRGDLG